MRNIVLVLIFIFVFIVSGYAAPCYGTRMPAKNGFSTGLQTYSIFHRDLEDNQGKVRSLQHFWLISYGVFDWLSIDLKGAVGNIKQNPQGGREIDYATSFAGGYGLRARLYDKDNIKAAFGFQHISVHPRSVFVAGVKNSAVLDDWQFSFLVSRGLKNVTPYLGTRWSRLDYIHWINEDIRKRKMSDMTNDIGLVFGCDIQVADKVRLNLEGQFFDTEAVAFSVNYDF